MDKSIVNQRFIECVNFLIDSKKVPSKSFLANKMDISNSKLSEILKKRMNAGIDVLIVLVSTFEVSAEWLLIGKGKMFKHDISEVSKTEEELKYTIELQKEIISNLKEQLAIQSSQKQQTA